MTGKTNTGGGALNFRVVGGTTAPANPGSNTIWVNTDITVTGYTFSNTEPQSPTRGLVWITTGTASPAAFSATNRNPVMLYPVSAKVYNGSAWTNVTAQSYVNGAWVPWIRDLYNAGNECTEATGGWSKAGGGASASGWNTNGIITEGASSVTLSTAYPSAISYAPQNAIDLSAYSSVIVTVSAYQGNDAAMVCICSVRGQDWNPTPTQGGSISGYPASTVAYARLNQIGETTVDVSALSGSYYVEITCAGGGSPDNSVTVTRVRVE